MTRAYVGTFSTSGTFSGSGEGVHAFDIDATTGEGTQVAIAILPDPSFLAYSYRHDVVYAACHVNRYDGEPGAVIVALRAADLTEIATRRIEFPHITYISLDPSERVLLAASSLGGGITTLPVLGDGSLGPVASAIRLPGEVLIEPGTTPEPIEVPGMPGITVPAMPKPGVSTIPHAIITDQSGEFALVPDLAQNTLNTFRLDATTGELSDRRSFPSMAPAAGPRQLACHPTLPIVYALNETNSTVSVLRLAAGDLAEEQAISTVAPGAPHASSSGVAVHPSGRWVYATNRKDSTIAAFEADADSGHLHVLEVVASQGERPYNVAVSPDGALVYISNNASGTVTAYRPGPDGRLAATGAELRVGSPTCALVVG